jgi:hypothetical protein
LSAKFAVERATVPRRSPARHDVVVMRAVVRRVSTVSLDVAPTD